MIEQLLGQEGQSRKAIKEFLELIQVAAQPMVDHMNRVTKVINDMHHQCQPILKDRLPPSNGPRYNPHARRGKGGRK